MVVKKGIWGTLACLVACGCNAQPAAPLNPEASDDGLSAVRPQAEADASSGSQPDATLDATGDASVDAPTLPGDTDAYPPQMACDVNASPEASVTQCPPPISVCAVKTGTGISYFDWGQCVGGRCTWTMHFTPCPQGGLCYSGACQSGPTM